MTKFPIKMLSVTIGVVLLSACATTQKGAEVGMASPTVQVQNQHGQPKEVLQEALKSQLRSSFDYRTDIYVSNQIRREALANATPEQLSAYDDLGEKCNIEHDEAYVAFLKTVKGDKGNIDDDKYKEQKDKIKSDFLACQKTLITEKDIFALTQDNSMSTDELIKTLPKMIADSQKNHQYDSNHTALDAKKAELVHEYLIKPSAVSMVGSYEPLKGVFLAFPSISYHAKNIKLHIAQPVYVDLNAGGIYLWADNFALVNSQTLDKTLGDKWKDKWLFLPINDGSLPENFTKDFIMAVKEAHKERFFALSAQDFGKGMTQLPFMDNLPQDKQLIIENTPTVIFVKNTPQHQAYADYVFKDTLYNNITSAYPELLPTEEHLTQEYDMVDGESVIHVKNVEKDLVDNEAKPKLNSRFLMTVLLANLREKADDYQNSLTQTQDDTADKDDKDDKNAKKYTPITHYGIERGKITWQHQRFYINSTLKTGQLSKIMHDEPLFVDVFTQIMDNPVGAASSQILRQSMANLQRPTANNTVNLFDYKDELQKALEKSDDKYLGMLSKLLFGQSQEEAETSQNEESEGEINIDEHQ